MMTPLNEFNFNDADWLDLESPMFTFINPNDICPTEILSESRVENLQANNNQSAYMYNTSIMNTFNTSNPVFISQQTAAPSSSYMPQQIVIQQQPQPLQEQENQVFQNQVRLQQLAPPACPQQLMIEPPSASFDEPKLILQHQLKLRHVLAKTRQERLRTRLEREPIQSPPRVMRKAGRKLTGRERQVELEKQEARELSLKRRYLEQIRDLEQKCSRLREILENIVTTSPDYKNQMMNFLESSELLFDRMDSTSNLGSAC